MAIDESPSVESEATAEKSKVVSCGNCGRRIEPHQARLQIYNTRYRNTENYHEDYRGCYESTRENPPMQRNRMEPWLNIALAGGMSVVFPHYESQSSVAGQE